MNHRTCLPAYLQRLGFTENPFPVTPDEGSMFFSARLAGQFSELLHFIEARKGFMLVTGDVGVGKSTLARLLLGRLARQGAATALVFNTFLQGIELLRAINRDFGIAADGETLDTLLQALNGWLLEQHALGRNCVLILDDAQGLDVASLELVRQLSNLEASQAKLLQIVMVAQPEIRQLLARHDLRQLYSRIALSLELLPLTLPELDQYLEHRLRLAGAPQAFRLDRRALRQLHALSGGYIRRVHILIDRCLYGLAASDVQCIDARLVRVAAMELHLDSGQRLRASEQRHSRLPLWLGGSLAVVALAAVALTLDLQKWSEQDLHPSPDVAPPMPMRAAEPETAAWQAFIDRHQPLQWQGPPPADWNELRRGLDAGSPAQPWIPVLLPGDAERDCRGQQSYPFGTGHLALFRSGLPVGPVSFGSRSEPVEALQKVLVGLDLLPAEAVDGVMGPRTATALAQFQHRHALLADGQPGAATVYLLGCLLPGDAP